MLSLAFNTLPRCYIKMIFAAVITIFTVICYVLPKRTTLQIRHILTSWGISTQDIKPFYRSSFR
jgi:hypothetical protein